MKRIYIILILVFNSILAAEDILVSTPIFKLDRIELVYITTDTVLDTDTKNEFGMSYTKNIYNFLNVNTYLSFAISDTKYYSSTRIDYGIGTELFYDFNQNIYISYATSINMRSHTYSNNGIEVASSSDIVYNNEIAMYFKSFKYLYNKIYMGISYNEEMGMYYGAAIKYEYISNLTFGYDMKVLSSNDVDFILTTGYNF
jgi:hypothetical protein